MLHSYQVENSCESSLLSINVFLGWIKFIRMFLQLLTGVNMEGSLIDGIST